MLAIATTSVERQGGSTGHVGSDPYSELQRAALRPRGRRALPQSPIDGGMSSTDSGQVARRRFDRAYDAVLARWPEPPVALDVPSIYGQTWVHICGPPEGPPVLLLPGAGATSTVWFATVGALAERHRVFAPDLIGDAGRSVLSGVPIRHVSTQIDWLDTLRESLGLYRFSLVGHSYGGWLALNYALNSPTQVSALSLVDPTDSFVGLTWSYRLRAAPVLLWPTARRMRRLLQWEAGDLTLDPDWLDLASAGADLPRPKLVLPRRPSRQQLRRLTVPTQVLVAGKSQAHDPWRLVAAVRRSMPNAEVVVLDEASHHTLPQDHSDRLNPYLTEFVGRSQEGRS